MSDSHHSDPHGGHAAPKKGISLAHNIALTLGLIVALALIFTGEFLLGAVVAGVVLVAVFNPKNLELPEILGGKPKHAPKHHEPHDPDEPHEPHPSH